MESGRSLYGLKTGAIAGLGHCRGGRVSIGTVQCCAVMVASPVSAGSDSTGPRRHKKRERIASVDSLAEAETAGGVCVCMGASPRSRLYARCRRRAPGAGPLVLPLESLMALMASSPLSRSPVPSFDYRLSLIHI